MTFNITAGECLNAILSEKYPERHFVPFNEAMIKGSYTEPLFSEEFLRQRASVHGVSVESYTQKLTPFLEVLRNVPDAAQVTLWFGDEPFCRANVQTVTEALRAFGCTCPIILHTVDEYSGTILHTQERP